MSILKIVAALILMLFWLWLAYTAGVGHGFRRGYERKDDA